MGLFDELMGKAPDPVPEIKSDTPHYEAIGRFITSYANAEAAVHLLARHLSGLSDEKARIVFGGMRLPDLTDIIRHFIKIDNLQEDTQAEIDECLRQLVLIAKRRHSLVHRSSHIFLGTLAVTNILTTKSMQAVETEYFSTDELSSMQSDCGAIYLRLDSIHASKPEKASFFRDTLRQRPWRYKHVPPKTPNLKHRAKSEAPKPQPPASPAKPEESER